MNSIKVNILSGTIYFISCALIILHPYTVVGRPGIIPTAIFAIYGIIFGALNNFGYQWILRSIALFVIGAFGMSISLVNDIYQSNHFYASISFVIISISAYGLALYCSNHKISFNTSVKFIYFAILCNCIIILLESYSPNILTLVESILIEPNVDVRHYEDGFRYRGIASSGGANLSILSVMGIVLGTYLYIKKALNPIALIISVFLIFFSTIFIGRSGVLLAPLGVIITFLFNIKIINQIRHLRLVIIALSIFYLFLPAAGYFLQLKADEFGAGYLDYVGGFFLSGQEGLQEEGTVSIIVEYLTVLPLSFPEFFIGYGFYGGSDFEPWTDSGYSRMFLSVGFLLGLIYYALIIFNYLNVKKEHYGLILPCLIVLLIAELKEPLLFSGYSARVMILITVFSWFRMKKESDNIRTI